MVRFKSKHLFIIEAVFMYWLDRGFVLKKAFWGKKYILFGHDVYTVIMEQGEKNYQELINKAVETENYEEAQKLTEEWKQNKD